MAFPGNSDQLPRRACGWKSENAFHGWFRIKGREVCWRLLGRSRTNPVGRKGQLKLDSRPVPWTWASRSLSAWGPWPVVLGYLPRAWGSVRKLPMVPATLPSYSLSQWGHLLLLDFWTLSPHPSEGPGDKCWTFLLLVVVLDGFAFCLWRPSWNPWSVCA